METRAISTETIEAQIVPKIRNNEPRPKFTGSHKKKCVLNLVGKI